MLTRGIKENSDLGWKVDCFLFLRKIVLKVLLEIPVSDDLSQWMKVACVRKGQCQVSGRIPDLLSVVRK